jgi:hypothetical protein
MNNKPGLEVERAGRGKREKDGEIREGSYSPMGLE